MKVYLEAPADRPLDEGQFLQLLQRSEQQAGLAQTHPAREHLLNGRVPVSYWLLVGQQAAELSTDHPR